MDERDDLSDRIAASGEAAGQAVSGPDGAATNGGQGNGPQAGSQASGTSGDAAAGSGAPSALESGASIGPYRVRRVVRAEPGEAVYIAERAQDPDEFAPAGSSAFVTLIERPADTFRDARQVAALGLRHPRLLAPLQVLTQGDRTYLALDAAATAEGEPLPSAAQGARLGPRATLLAGAGLADTLAYLHRSGVAHGHLTPDNVFVRDGRALLGGMDRATVVPQLADETPEAQDLVARDANLLAQTLGALLAPAAGEEEAGDDQGLADAVREIAAQGAADAFASPNDLAGVCAVALQQTDRLLERLQVTTPPARIHLNVAAATSVGRIRSENQDACASLVVDVLDDVGDGSPASLLLVADGMGGEARGELASRIAARIVTAELARQFAVPAVAVPALLVTSETGQEAIERPSDTSITQALTRAVALANHQIRELARQLGQTTGTTLTAIAISGTHAALAHVGDSRAYLLRDGVLHTLTEDHSVLARLQAIDHPLLSDPDVFVPRSMLYRSLGQEDDAQADMIEFTVAAGDRYLICSDGLWDEVDPASLERTLADATEPAGGARQLVALANAAGGHDNSTAVVAFVRALAPDDAEASGVGGPEPAAETEDVV